MGSRIAAGRRGRDIGRARRIEDARGRYIHAVKTLVRDEVRLDGLKVVIDCANGAAYKVAPDGDLGAGRRRSSPSASSPTASTSTTRSARPRSRRVKARCSRNGADIGLALDGDADRLIVVDEKGETVDGDQIMALIASRWPSAGQLEGGGVVATVM